ncbi:MAG: aldo/keto reductase [Vulcanimicrobiota bacterium]
MKEPPSSSETNTVSLKGGVSMPLLGLGVFQVSPGEATRAAVATALALGYRLIDTAAYYGNEADVKIGLERSGVDRSEVFLTSKVWLDDQGYDQTLRAFDRSAKLLGVETLDLYLIHWPVERLHLESWRALVRLWEEGRCRAIGVSNYTENHLDQLAAHSPVTPAVNQVEFHPFVYRSSLLERCRSADICLQAYAPLVRAERMNHPSLVETARKYGKSVAQLLLRWNLEHGIPVIPKTTRPDRMKENLEVFDFALSPEDVRSLDELSCGFRVCWNPYD